MVSSATDREAGELSRARKRERDKENQRQKRQREKEALQELQRRNESLERQVKELRNASSGNDQQLVESVQLLRAKNQALEARLGEVDAFIQRWVSPNKLDDTNSVSASRNGGLRGGDGGRDSSHKRVCGQSLEASPSDNNSEINGLTVVGTPNSIQQYAPIGLWSKSACTTLSEPTFQVEDTQDVLALPVWKRMPANTQAHRCHDPFKDIILQLRTHPEQLLMCPLAPKALDLFIGGSLNVLANAVCESTLHCPFRRTEKLAVNLTNYSVARWITDSTEESYSMVPVPFRPTMLQLMQQHPPMYDYVVWPQMRDNFIKHGMKYCTAEVFGLLFCTCRIRGTINSHNFVCGGPDAPTVDPEFLARIWDVDGWVLLDKFWIEYPELVEGLDQATVMITERDLA